ncbi:hypothetical protein PF005_g18126 [Phytophthora fragariae]|uniref:Uncharacterized protein n=1 Tax=Phytophthora fragariae TaxID=53985 RepID=A0A6A3WYE2_9STRA|nr:hypothetical protein PF003_g22683 [Phytophthora fragariae]KAE8930720.1 hypothetical protein PF009_g19202 [Phytophthora fragariae]KAE9025184.1 hypothetical protein PF011_g3162 [Phytophthora fragariae]KAE9093307.1 hypothetical protein PF007_g18185 [Phytophthora fragariae]KAE9093513.1 hypothetical protein PF010_g17458 [Phytophthora fragariae]
MASVARVSVAVAFTVDPLAARDSGVELSLRLESKRAADTSSGSWQRVRDEPLKLQDVNIVSQLNRAQFAYRLSLRPAASDATQTAAFPIFLEVPALPSSPRDDADVAEMCPPQVGTFAVAEQFQCQSPEQNVADSTSASQAAAMLGGTLAAALLVYSLLPYVRSRNRKRCRSRSRTHSQTINEGLSWCGDQQEIPSTPTTPNGASRRMWGSLDDDGIEPARAYRDGLRERKSRQPEANGSAVSDAGSELMLAKLPDFNDERGWRDFFDSQIYHNEPQEEQRAATKPFLSVKTRGDPELIEAVVVKRTDLRQIKTAASAATRSDRYKSIRDKIDRASMEAAVDEAQSFYEFWQM